MNTPISSKPPVASTSNFLGKVWIDTAQITRIETAQDGKRHIKAGLVTGWAIGPEPFTTIEVVVNGKRVARAKVGRYRPDIAELYPSIPHAEYTGFEAILTQGELPEGPCDIILMAVSTSGKVFVKRQHLSGTDGLPGAGVAAMRTHIERCELDGAGTLCVSGWAVSQTPIISVQLFGNGSKIAGTLPGLPRPDVAEMFPHIPNSDRSGFYVTASLPARAQGDSDVITIEVLARDGTLRRVVTTPRRVLQLALPPAPIAAAEFPSANAPVAPPPIVAEQKSPPPEDIWFFCDTVHIDTEGKCQLSGWSAAMAGLESLSLNYGGVVLGQAELGLPRPDVARAYPQLSGNGRAGFSFDLTHREGFPEGPASLVVTATLRDGTQRQFDVDAMIVQPAARVSHYDNIVLGLDTFQIVSGRATKTVTGAFQLGGWAVARAGVRQIEVFLDGQSLGLAYIGIRRDELQAIFFDFPDTLRAGFALSVPTRFLKDGQSEIRILITDLDGKTLEQRFNIDIAKTGAEGATQALRHKMPWAEAQTGLDIIAARGPLPVCDVVLRLDGRRGQEERALASLASLARQVWPEWRLWLAPTEDAAAESGAGGAGVRAMCKALVAARPQDAARIALLTEMPARNNDGLVAILNAGDILAADGLLAPLLALRQSDALVYADDRRPDPQNPGSLGACRKPGWSPDLILSQNYIGRAWLARHRLLVRAGLTPQDLARSGDYAAVLALTSAAGPQAIRHLPSLMIEAAGARETPATERRSLTAHLRAAGLDARVQPGAAPFLHRVARKAAKAATVSIIIPSIGAKDHIIRCLESIRSHQTAMKVEIVIVDNLRRRGLNAAGKAWKAWFRAHADTVVEVDEPFNWSRLNNLGAAAAKGDYLLFLNDDIEVISPDWLDVLVAEAARPEVGVVGAQLLYPDGKVQHAGMFLSRSDMGNARHAFRFADANDPGYFGLALSQRNVLCVTGACMMVRRAVFDDVNGFDEAHSVVNNDVDFCLRLHRAGRLVVFTPHARLTHHELASRANLKDNFDRRAFLQSWGDLCQAGDPYFNPALSTEADDYAPEEEPLREVYAGHPLGARDKIQRILAVKLDHIGDLVTALPALRRLKALFPHAHLTALVGRSAMGIAAMETAIDTLIPFEFFAPRSGLGRKKLSKADYAALEADLKARNFDLALDLRKLGDTRHILQHSGAPLMAGFDHKGEFPWLDITLEWERDALQVEKRNHVATDLLNLIEAVGTAFVTDRRTIATPASALPPLSDGLRAEFADLFANPYVVIHPAAGTPLRQWAPEKFARLIDLLADEDDMRVALIGGPDERDIAERVLEGVRCKDRVFNLVGRSKLAEVPRIMAESLLFVGNNSGPSHIASGLGVPTVSVHSALVSSQEWGPLGPAAVALRRNMSCAPCYIASVEQCHRAMACLTSLTPFAVHDLCRRFLALRQSKG